jgi:hypothetical protein
MNYLELQTLMTMPQDTLVPWGPNGKVITISDALTRLFNGEGADVMPAAQPAAQPAQPGQPGAPGLTISQRAADSISQAQYDELKQTGHIQGLTNSDNGRALVHVRNSSGTVRTDFSFDPETGKIGPGRGIDLRDFDAPAEK